MNKQPYPEKPSLLRDLRRQPWEPRVVYFFMIGWVVLTTCVIIAAFLSVFWGLGR